MMEGEGDGVFALAIRDWRRMEGWKEERGEKTEREERDPKKTCTVTHHASFRGGPGRFVGPPRTSLDPP